MPAHPTPSRNCAYADRTIAAYRWQAGKAITNWTASWKPSAFLRRFIRTLPSHGNILDYGCGIGIEMAWMQKKGFLVEGIDGTLEFVKESRRRCPDVKITHARFENAKLSLGAYDGIWCNAALIHVPPQEMKRQLGALRRCLKPNGILGLSCAWGRMKGFTRRDWIPGRYIAGYRKEELKTFFDQWTIHDIKVTSRASREGRWIQILASSC